MASDSKFIDPTPVLDKFVDDEGQVIPVGAQKDIIEFMMNFFERIQEVLIVFSKETGNKEFSRSKSEIGINTLTVDKKNNLHSSSMEGQQKHRPTMLNNQGPASFKDLSHLKKAGQ